MAKEEKKVMEEKEKEKKEDKKEVDKRSWFKRWISNGKLWCIFSALNLSGSICTAFILIYNTDISKSYSFLITSTMFFLIEAAALYQGIGKIPQKWNWNIEVWGHCEKAYSSGVCFLFPWFGIISYVDVYMGERPLELLTDEAKENKGDIELVEASAYFDITVFYKVEDSIKAAYNVSDLRAVLEEKLDSKVRSYLGMFNIEEAIKLKAKVNTLDFLEGNKSSLDLKGEKSPHIPTREDLMKNDFWKEIWLEWGVAITDIAIADITLSDDLREAREAITIAERAAERAKKEKEKTIIDAKAKQEAFDLIGQGYAQQITSLVEKGLSAQQAASYLQERMKWSNVGEKGATVILDSGDNGSLASLGTKIGAGMKAIPETTTTKE